MLNENVSAVQITKTLDNRASDCASGFVKLLDAMHALTPGEVLRVLSTDRASRRELADWAQRSGNELLESSASGPFWSREYRYLIRKV
jgi:tRNA 2-thiouridine synthesizing protein A